MLLNTSKNKAPFWHFQVICHRYLDIGRDNDDGYSDGESRDQDYYEEHDQEKHALIRHRQTTIN